MMMKYIIMAVFAAMLALALTTTHVSAQVIIGGQHQGTQGTPGGSNSCTNNCQANSGGSNGGSASGHTNFVW